MSTVHLIHGFMGFEKQLKALCSTTIQALIDTYMFMFPVAYKYEDTNTYLFRYTF